MRTTGENFARGSCRALKWVALLGVVFALGSAPADAQITISSVNGTAVGTAGNVQVVGGGASSGSSSPKVMEGRRAEIKVKIVGIIEPTHTSTSTVTVNISPLAVAGFPAAPAGSDVTRGEANDRGTAGLDWTSGTITIPAHDGGAADDMFEREATVYFQVPDDIDAEDEIIAARIQLTAVEPSGNAAHLEMIAAGTALLNQSQDRALIIEDDETQSYGLRVTTAAASRTEGSNIQLALTATPPHTPTGGSGNDATAGNTQSVDLYVVDEDGRVLIGYEFDGGNRTTIGSGGGSATVNTPSNDGNRTADTIVVRMAREGQLAVEAETTIEIADVHALPAADKITAQAYASNASGAITTTEVDEVTEGAEHPVHVTVTVDRGTSGYPSDEEIQVVLRPADGSTAGSLDYELEDAGTSDLTFGTGTGKKTATFKLRATGNDSDIGDETLVFELRATGKKTPANGSGESIGSYEIRIVDATTPQVSPKTTEEAQSVIDEAMAAADIGDDLNPGESFMLDASDLFGEPAVGFDVSYGVAVVRGGEYADASLRGGDMVTVTARAEGTAEGTALVRVTATATARTSSVVVPNPQTQANVAQVDFEVDVKLAALEVTLSAPENMRTLTEGDDVTITATANRPLTADDDRVVTLRPGSGSQAANTDYTLEPEAITIAVGETTGTATLTARTDDNNAEGNETLVLEGSMGGMELNSLTFTIADPELEPLAITLAAPNLSLTEGDDVTVTATANRAVTEATVVSLSGTGESTAAPVDYTVGNITIAAGATTGTATLTAQTDDEEEGTETLMLQGSVGNVTTNTLNFMIADPLAPLSVMLSAETTSLTEGGSTTVTARANRAVEANTEVRLVVTAASTAAPADYMLADSITIAAGETAGTATLTAAVDDNNAEGNETLVLQGSVGSIVSNMLEITISDPAVEALVVTLSAPEDMRTLFEGATVQVTATANRAVREATVVRLNGTGSSTAAPADYSIDNITIPAGGTSGSATLTVRTDGEMEGNETLVLQGSVGDMETNTLTFTIRDPLAALVVTLSAPGDGNITEGASVTVTATANRAVEADTTVRLVATSASTAAPADYTLADSITIAAGATTGTATLTAVADDDAERSEMLVLQGMVGSMTTNTLQFYIWDAAVPALPVIAQLLLAAFLAIGGYRRYLRR